MVQRVVAEAASVRVAVVEAADEFVLFIFSEKVHSASVNIALILPLLQCFVTFFTDFNFFNGDCLKATVSKGLSYAIVAGAVALKAPCE